LRQRQLAALLAERHKGEGWTITHGFFATMGGFMEYDGNRPIRVLLPDQLESYSLTGNGDFPRISKAEIEDKSKGDAISKALAILQTSWFVTQCIARGVQGLPITQLEIITVAFSAFNFVIYLIWWDKPLNVKRGVRVYEKRRNEQPVDDGHVEVAPRNWVVLRDAFSGLTAAIVRGPIPGICDKSLWLFRIVLWCFVKPYDILIGIEEERDEKRVGTFYPFEWTDAKSATSVVLAVASGFGGIHCIGWSFGFPSGTEQTLWRVASITITVVPLGVLIFPFLPSIVLSCLPSIRLPRDHPQFMLSIFVQTAVLGYVWFILLSVAPVPYLTARLILLVLPFLSLMSLPPTAYHVVHWTLHIPHV